MSAADMDVFPINLFPPTGWNWTRMGTPMTGGQPITGAPQTANASAGGWWEAQWDTYLLTLDQIGAWESIMEELQDGAMIALPVLTAQQPWPGGISRLAEDVPFSDGASFSDGSLFASDTISATLAAAAYAPSYPAPPVAPITAQIDMAVGGALRGVEWFTLIGASGYPRAHKITRVPNVSGSVSTVKVVPPFRENYAAGTRALFDRPMCTMKLAMATINAGGLDMGPGYCARASARFVETAF